MNKLIICKVKNNVIFIFILVYCFKRVGYRQIYLKVIFFSEEDNLEVIKVVV